jgi:processive 1,2-diacylglycerol beta-glucosyltransferase
VIEVRDKATRELLGTISEEELKALRDQLEETDSTDTDYYIDEATIAMMAEQDAPVSLVEFLRRALGSRDGLEIQWSRR